MGENHSHWQESRSRKISRRNDSIISLSLEKMEFSVLFLVSIFKMLRKKFSFSSWFMRFLITILFLFSNFKIFKNKYFDECLIFYFACSEVFLIVSLVLEQYCFRCKTFPSHAGKTIYNVNIQVIIVMISNSKKSNTWKSILTRSFLDVGMLWHVKVVAMIYALHCC